MDEDADTPRTIVVDIHEEEIVTVESVDEIIQISVENVEKTVSSKETIETVEESEPVKQDDAVSSRKSQLYAESSSIFFKCKMCDFAAARKTNLRNHKKTSHNWCFICFSTFTSQDDLKDHFYKVHSKNEEDLELALGKAPR